MPLRPLASVNTWKVGRESWINEIEDQLVRNNCHHCRSFLTGEETRVRRKRVLLCRSEKSWRRKGRPKGTTWQQWDRKPRISSSLAWETDFLVRRVATSDLARDS